MVVGRNPRLDPDGWVDGIYWGPRGTVRLADGVVLFSEAKLLVAKAEAEAEVSVLVVKVVRRAATRSIGSSLFLLSLSFLLLSMT